MDNTESSAPTTDPRHEPTDDAIAIHVLHFLTRQQLRGHKVHFDKLYRSLRVRRLELQRVLGFLDRQGLVDAAALRTTLAGFAIGMSLRADELPALRRSAAPAARRRAA
jgi:hypothetical protein